MSTTLLIRGVTFGDGTNYCWDEGGPAGLGEPVPNNNDVQRGAADGSQSQADWLPPRQLNFPFVIGNPRVLTKAASVTALESARVAWTRSQVDLSIVLTMEGHAYTFVGRPNGFTVDLSHFFIGVNVIRMLCSFRGVDPAIY